MEKRDIIRALTWGLTFFILAAAGIYGMILNDNSKLDNSPNKLENITNFVNESALTKALSEQGTNIYAETNGSKMTVSYITNTKNKKYYYTYSNNNLYSEFENDDEIATEVLKIVLAANAENLGQNYSDILLKFSELDLTIYSIDEGISYEVSDKTNVIINTNLSLTIKEPEYFTELDLSSSSTNIINGNYTNSKNAIKLNINGKTPTIITVSEENELTSNSYKSIISVLNVLFEDKEIINYFKENYSSITLGNKTFNGFKIEINPTLNNNEKAIFRPEENIIRVTINKDQL